jgi:hypothetical protein
MGQEINTIESRIKFVKGWLTGDTPITGAVECGDGTLFPLEVTVDQLAEIFYRVRDAALTSTLYTSGVALQVGGTPPEKLVKVEFDSDYEHYLTRGYYKADPVVAWMDPYYDVAYSTLLLFGDYRDAIKEPSIWTYFDATIQTGFSLSMSGGSAAPFTSGPPSIYCVYYQYDDVVTYYELGNTSFIFSGQVAWVDDANSGSPFSPGNRLFIGIEIVASVGSTLFGVSSPNADADGFPGVLATDSFFIFEMASGTPSVRIYNYTPETTSGDLTLTATAWWPYAKGSPPTPQWDKDTGLPL